MGRTLQLGTLVTRCQQRADRVGDGHIGGDDTTEWQSLVSEAYGEMYMIAAESGLLQYVTEATITADGSASYALPSDYLSTIEVDYVRDSAGRRRPLDEIMVQERAALLGETGDATRFCLFGSAIELYARPTTGTYKHLYIPQPADLSTAGPTTSVDLLNVHGQAFVIWSVKLKALDKSESDVQVSMTQIARHAEKLAEWCALRSFNTPRRAVWAGGGDEGRLPGDWP